MDKVKLVIFKLILNDKRCFKIIKLKLASVSVLNDSIYSSASSAVSATDAI